jgi:hypothetical protein
VTGGDGTSPPGTSRLFKLEEGGAGEGPAPALWTAELALATAGGGGEGSSVTLPPTLASVVCKDLHISIGRAGNAISLFLCDLLREGVEPAVPLLPQRTLRSVVVPGDALLRWALSVPHVASVAAKAAAQRQKQLDTGPAASSTLASASA